MVIVFETSEGLGFISPAPDSGVPIEQIIEREVPAGSRHAVMERDAIPSDRTYQAAWRLDLTDADAPTIVTDANAKAEIDRNFALKATDAWFRQQLDAGFTTNDGWTLGLAPDDVTLLTGNYVLAKEAAALGGDIPPVIDTDGVPHPMESIEELTALMLAYGQHRAALSAEYAARKAAILGAE